MVTLQECATLNKRPLMNEPLRTIIFQLDTQARRYSELRRMIPDVSEKILVQELKALTTLGVVEKKSHNEVPPRVEYNLTTKGLRILPMLLELMAVGEMFMEP